MRAFAPGGLHSTDMPPEGRRADRQVDLGGRARLSVEAPGVALARAVTRAMDPYPIAVGLADHPDVLIEVAPRPSPQDIRERQGDAGDGRTTATDGRRLYLVEGGHLAGLPSPDEPGPATLTLEPSFPPHALLADVVRPMLQHALLDHGAAAIHGSSVRLDGGAVVLAGWSESGKTEIALAMVEAGARFLSDKWTIVDSGAAALPFPAPVSIRRWVLPYLPRLRASIAPIVRAQLFGAGAAARLLGPARRLRNRSMAADRIVAAVSRSVELADRRSLLPSEVLAAYGQPASLEPVPLRAIVLLTTTEGSTLVAREADPTWAARRLTRSASFERRAYWGLVSRAAFAFARRAPDEAETQTASHQAASVREREEALLVPVLERVRVLEVRASFPTDPRPIAESIAGWL